MRSIKNPLAPRYFISGNTLYGPFRISRNWVVEILRSSPGMRRARLDWVSYPGARCRIFWWKGTTLTFRRKDG